LIQSKRLSFGGALRESSSPKHGMIYIVFFTCLFIYYLIGRSVASPSPLQPKKASQKKTAPKRKQPVTTKAVDICYAKCFMKNKLFNKIEFRIAFTGVISNC
jgi:hypothetical protein